MRIVHSIPTRPGVYRAGRPLIAWKAVHLMDGRGAITGGAVLKLVIPRGTTMVIPRPESSWSDRLYQAKLRVGSVRVAGVERFVRRATRGRVIPQLRTDWQTRSYRLSSHHNPNFTYRLGHPARVEYLSEMVAQSCGGGIHCFRTRRRAYVLMRYFL